MSSLITNPEYLSKDRLKSELKTHGVRFNHNENKQYYVNLYRKRIMDTEQSRQEFSSDEEFTRPSKQEKKQQKRRKIVKMDTYLSDVQLLLDDELREELEKYDKECGPITDSTRGLYQRMLAKLMAENVTGKSSVSRTIQPRDSTEEDEDDEENERGVGRTDYSVGEWSSEDSEEEEEETVEDKPPPVASPSQLKKRIPHVREPLKPVPAAAKVGKAPAAEKPRGKPYRRTAPKSTSFQGFLVLLLMFIVAFFSYEHYTSTEEDPSLVTKGWTKSGCLWNHVKKYIIKTSPLDEVKPTQPPDDEVKSTQPPDEELPTEDRPPPSTNEPTQPPPTKVPTQPPTNEPTQPPPTKVPTQPPTEKPTQPPPTKAPTQPPTEKQTQPPKEPPTPPPKKSSTKSKSSNAKTEKAKKN